MVPLGANLDPLPPQIHHTYIHLMNHDNNQPHPTKDQSKRELVATPMFCTDNLCFHVYADLPMRWTTRTYAPVISQQEKGHEDA
jgi:hypothetical protein